MMASVKKAYAIPRWNKEGDCYLFLPASHAPQGKMACFTILAGFSVFNEDFFYTLLSVPPHLDARDYMYEVIGCYRKIIGPDTVVYITHKNYRKFQDMRY